MFQKVIQNSLAVATPGDIVMANDSFKVVKQCIAGDATIEVGTFVRIKADDDLVVLGAIGNTPALGVVVKDKYITACNTPTMLVPEGDGVTILVEGIVAIKAPVEAKANYLVCINDSTGVVEFVQNPASVPNGSTNTSWIVFQPCRANEICFIKSVKNINVTISNP